MGSKMFCFQNTNDICVDLTYLLFHLMACEFGQKPIPCWCETNRNVKWVTINLTKNENNAANFHLYNRWISLVLGNLYARFMQLNDKCMHLSPCNVMSCAHENSKNANTKFWTEKLNCSPEEHKRIPFRLTNKTNTIKSTVPTKVSWNMLKLEFKF